MKFVAAKCPNCQGELQVPTDRDFVKCMYCGCDIKVRDSISLNLQNQIPEFLNLAKTEEMVFNYGKADYYYSKALELDSKNSEAWFGKGDATLKMASTDDYVILEVRQMEEYFNKAIEYSGDKEGTKIQIENIICAKISVEFFTGIDVQFAIDIDEITNLSIQCIKFIEALGYAKELNPTHIFYHDRSKVYDCKTPDELILMMATAMYHVDSIYKAQFQACYNKYKK